MTDEAALEILRERRGTMYDPLIVDLFSSNHHRIMPVEETTTHPAARAVGGAREITPSPAAPPVVDVAGPDLPAPATDATVLNEVLAVSSLARAMAGNATVSDVGALAWMSLRSIIPATAMALFVDDERRDLLTVAYAAGPHAQVLRQLQKTRGGGIAGWAAVNRRGVLNADPALDLGPGAATLEPPLRSSLSVPLAHDSRVVGVLSCYSSAPQGFTEDHLRLLEVLSASLAAAISSVDGADLAARPHPAPSSRRVLTLAS
jgi:hypothetical protein